MTADRVGPEPDSTPQPLAAPVAEPPSPLTRDVVVVQRPAPDVEWVEVEGAVVAWNADAESLHLLDALTGLAFMLADGEASLGQTVDELADAHGQSTEVVGPPVLAAAARLASLGLVEVVR